MNLPYDLRGKTILVTGGRGFLGRHLVARLLAHGVKEQAIRTPSHEECDLLRLEDCVAACRACDVVFHLAARVGGIAFNLREPGRIFYENAVMNSHVLEAARLCRVERLVATGSVCAYPNVTPVPTREEHLYDGKPESSNLAYGLTKRILHAQIEAYRAQYRMSAVYVLPANLYGPGDNFHPEDSHVIPALIRRFAQAADSGARAVSAWGDGLSTREFLFAPDCAEGMVRAAEKYDDDAPLNLSSDREVSIRDLARIIAGLTGFRGEVLWDASRPSGQRRRHYDASRSVALLGDYARTSLEEGLAATVAWYRQHVLPGEKVS